MSFSQRMAERALHAAACATDLSGELATVRLTEGEWHSRAGATEPAGETGVLDTLLLLPNKKRRAPPFLFCTLSLYSVQKILQLLAS